MKEKTGKILQLTTEECTNLVSFLARLCDKNETCGMKNYIEVVAVTELLKKIDNSPEIKL